MNLNDITLSPIPKQKYNNEIKDSNLPIKTENKRRRYLSLKKMYDEHKLNVNNEQFFEKSPDIISNSEKNTLCFNNRINYKPIESTNENLAMKPFSELLKYDCKTNNKRRKFSGHLLGGNEKCIPKDDNIVNKQFECTISTPRINESKRSP